MILSGVPDQMVDAITLLRERAENDEANVLYSLVNDLSKVYTKVQNDSSRICICTYNIYYMYMCMSNL